MKRLLFLLLLCWTPALADVCPEHESVSREMIVKFRPGCQRELPAEATLLHRFASGAEHWRLDTDERPWIADLRSDPCVEYAEPDYIVWADAIPNDPRWGTSGAYGMTLIDLPHARDITKGDPNVVIGVLDTGSGPHTDLDGNLVPGLNLIDPNRSWDDDNRHGTHTACTAGCVGDNGIGFIGVCERCSMKPYKFLNGCGSGFSSDAIAAIDDATANHVPVLSNSWGGGGFSQALYDSINTYCASGGVFVASAGNNGGGSNADNDVTPQYPASYDLPCIISVAATEQSDLLTGFSSFGLTTVDLGAPGSGILSGFPYPYTCGGLTLSDFGILSGTSMACPHVAGVAGLLKSLHPEWTGADIKAAILSSVDLVPSLAGKTVTGGRLNAARAVGYVAPPPPPTEFCSDGECNGTETCKVCPDDCGQWIKKPRRDARCCGDGKLQPGERNGECGDNP